MVGGCGSGGVAVEWLVVCCEMGVWLWVWLFMGVLWLWVWVFLALGMLVFYGCEKVFVGVSSFCVIFYFIYLMGINCLYHFIGLYSKIRDEI